MELRATLRGRYTDPKIVATRGGFISLALPWQGTWLEKPGSAGASPSRSWEHRLNLDAGECPCAEDNEDGGHRREDGGVEGEGEVGGVDHCAAEAVDAVGEGVDAGGDGEGFGEVAEGVECAGEEEGGQMRK